MQVTEQLSEEHVVIIRLLDVLDRMIDAAEVGEQLDMGDLMSIHHLIVTFADKCHHGKEEVVLFPRMRAHRDIIAGLLREHVQGRGYVREMKSFIDESSSGDVSAQRSFADRAKRYSELIRNHIDKEECDTFPLAEQEIEDREKMEMLEEFEEIEEKRIGKGGHEKLLETLEGLYNKFIISPA